MKLTNPTPDEIDAAVAEKVARWNRLPRTAYSPESWQLGSDYRGYPPCYSRSTDAVLPLLERYSVTVERVCYEEWDVSVTDSETEDDGIDYNKRGTAKSLPLALCIALLRANGVEVEFTK